MLCSWIYPYYLAQRAKFLATLPIEVNFKPLQVTGNGSLQLFEAGLFDKLLEDKMSKELKDVSIIYYAQIYQQYILQFINLF